MFSPDLLLPALLGTSSTLIALRWRARQRRPVLVAAERHGARGCSLPNLQLSPPHKRSLTRGTARTPLSPRESHDAWKRANPDIFEALAALPTSSPSSPLSSSSSSSASASSSASPTSTYDRFVALDDPRTLANADAVTAPARVAQDTRRLGKVLPMSMYYLDKFLGWRCGHALLSLGLFPNAQEITESMACLWAVQMHLADTVRFADADVTCVVVGDGRKPRTAALLSFRTKWRRIISIDPDMRGGDEAMAAVQRLETRAVKIQDTAVHVDPVLDRVVVVILPHAHVSPNSAVGSLRLAAMGEGEGGREGGEGGEGDGGGEGEKGGEGGGVGEGDRAGTSAITSTITFTEEVLTASPSPSPTAMGGTSRSNSTSRGASGTDIAKDRDMDNRDDDEPRASRAFHGSPRPFQRPPRRQPVRRPVIVVVQMPCCDYEYHDRCVRLPPDVEYEDVAISSSRRRIKIWRDVGEAAVADRAVHIGPQEPQIRLRFPHSCSVDRVGWQKAARKARQRRRGVDPDKDVGPRDGTQWRPKDKSGGEGKSGGPDVKKTGKTGKTGTAGKDGDMAEKKADGDGGGNFPPSPPQSDPSIHRARVESTEGWV